MSLSNPFVTTFGKKLESNRICQGFGSLNNFGDSTPPDGAIGASGVGFPQDVYGFRPHISLIFVFTEDANIKLIEGSTFRSQIGAGTGSERSTGTTRLFCRVLGFRGLGQNIDILRRTIFDPMGWSKEDAVIRLNAGGLLGIDLENTSAWEGNPPGRFYKWVTSTAQIFYDKLITRDEQFVWQTNLQVRENDVLLMTPAYHDRNFCDTSTSFPVEVFKYAGSPPGSAGGVDFRNNQVLRTFMISGDTC